MPRAETVTVYDRRFGAAAGDGSRDDTEPVQQFFDYIANNECEKATIAGTFKITDTIRIRGWGDLVRPSALELNPQTSIIDCDARFFVDEAADGSPPPEIALDIDYFRWVHFRGRILVDGHLSGLYVDPNGRDREITRNKNFIGVPRHRDGTTPSAATIGHFKTSTGIRIRGCTRTKFDHLAVSNMALFGVDVEGDPQPLETHHGIDPNHTFPGRYPSLVNPSNNFLEIGYARVARCGPYVSGGVSQHRASWSNPRTETDATRIDVTPLAGMGEAHPPTSRSAMRATFVRIDDEFYQVLAVEGDSLTLSPQISGDAASGELDYYYGAGVRVSGSDSSDVGFGTIDGAGCAITLADQATYGPVVNRLASHICGIGYVNGHRQSAGGYGATITNMYNEGDTPVRILNNSWQRTMSVLTTHGAGGPDRIRAMAPRAGYSSLRPHNIAFVTGGQMLEPVGPREVRQRIMSEEPDGQITLANEWTTRLLRQRKLTVLANNSRHGVRVILPPMDPDKDLVMRADYDTWGYDTIEITVVGPDAPTNHTPTGPVHFLLSGNAGWTFSELGGPLSVTYQTAGPPTSRDAEIRQVVEFTGPVTFAAHYDFSERVIRLALTSGTAPTHTHSATAATSASTPEHTHAITVDRSDALVIDMTDAQDPVNQ